jgi:outer membrane protein OmpA-like peptidoglycan-associated protein
MPSHSRPAVPKNPHGNGAMRSFVLSAATAGLALLAFSASQATATADAVPSAKASERSYVVFFENNQATLTPEGREIVKAAADRARYSHASLVTVSAPATRVLAGYNPSVAQPRLMQVQQALIANGVPRDRVARATVSNKVNVPLVGAERVEIRVVTNRIQQTI